MLIILIYFKIMLLVLVWVLILLWSFKKHKIKFKSHLKDAQWLSYLQMHAISGNIVSLAEKMIMVFQEVLDIA